MYSKSTMKGFSYRIGTEPVSYFTAYKIHAIVQENLQSIHSLLIYKIYQNRSISSVRLSRSIKVKKQ